MKPELNPTDSSVIDVLLREAIGNERPPDLTGPILDRLADQSLPQPIRVKPAPVPQATGRGVSVAWVVGAIAATAALLLAIVTLRDPETRVADNLATAPSIGSSTDPKPAKSDSDVSAAPIDATDPTETPPPPAGILLPIDPPEAPPETSIAGGTAATPPPTAGPPVTPRSPRKIPDAAAPIDEIATRSATRLVSAWRDAGVQPTPDDTLDQISKRLSTRLGVDIPTDLIEDTAGLKKFFADPDRAFDIADALTADVYPEPMRDIIAASLRSETKLDRTVADAFAGLDERDQDNSGWLGQMAGSMAPHRFVRTIAEMTLGVDARCVRCHDDATGLQRTQRDYWAFHALLTRQGHSFFELPDGRQAMAEPGVPAAWMGRDADGSRGKLSAGEWADRLIGSNVFAAATIDQLWRAVHGRPLVKSPLDPGPDAASLRRLRDELAGDLIASDFDLARALALVVTSPAARRAPVDDAAARAVFAASTPVQPQVWIGDRLVRVMKSIGRVLDGVSTNRLLAQIGDRPGPSTTTFGPPQTVDDFPIEADMPSVEWLDRLDDLSERIRHLAYLSDRTETPPEVAVAVDAMLDEQVKPATILARVWWMLR